jgi:hypothetical protein
MSDMSSVCLLYCDDSTVLRFTVWCRVFLLTAQTSALCLGQMQSTPIHAIINGTLAEISSCF